MDIGKEELVQMYQKMLTIRRFEERIGEDSLSGAIPGVAHSSVGQEAVAVGVCANLTADDRLVSNHRGHGHCIAKGADINRMMAEVYGKKTGYCKGKGGSMHIADFSIGMLGANGILAAGLPIALGAALAGQLEGGDKVAVVFFGDGSSNEGAFHESLNLASIWKLPIIFACENNLYAINMSIRDAVATENIADRAAAYSMPGIIVDGNDVVAVHEATRKAVAGLRAGGGPVLMEFKTYRWRKHFERYGGGDTRPPEELEAWKKKDPITGLGRRLLEAKIVTQRELDAIEEQVSEQVKDAVNYALESPFPEPQDALDDVFSS
ncbi:thiamine pyrophosphate-dependent dehydrogenase E1 component subunit alpha [Chloroflexota bacterium]